MSKAIRMTGSELSEIDFLRGVEVRGYARSSENAVEKDIAGVGWPSYGAVSPDEAIQFAYIVLSRAHEAKRINEQRELDEQKNQEAFMDR